jgi:hypothetical protein
MSSGAEDTETGAVTNGDSGGATEGGDVDVAADVVVAVLMDGWAMTVAGPELT